MQEQENMEPNAPQQNPPFNPNQPVHHSVWIPVVVIAGLVVGYLALAGANDWWPFGGENVEYGMSNMEESTSPQPSPSPGEGELADWQAYRNEEFGFEVRYPGEYDVRFIENSEIQGIDSGREATFNISRHGEISPFSFSMFSNDFGRGVGEGCCFEYADEPIDLNRSDEEIKEDLYGKFGEVMDFRRISIGGRTGVRFFRLNSYAGSWVVDSVLFPLDKSPFANLLISSGTIVYFEDSVGDYAKQRELARDFVDSREYVEKEEYTLFNKILSAFRFIK